MELLCHLFWIVNEARQHDPFDSLLIVVVTRIFHHRAVRYKLYLAFLAVKVLLVLSVELDWDDEFGSRIVHDPSCFPPLGLAKRGNSYDCTLLSRLGLGNSLLVLFDVVFLPVSTWHITRYDKGLVKFFKRFHGRLVILRLGLDDGVSRWNFEPVACPKVPIHDTVAQHLVTSSVVYLKRSLLVESIVALLEEVNLLSRGCKIRSVVII